MKIFLIIFLAKLTFSSENEKWKGISTKNSCDNYLIANFMVFLYAYGRYDIALIKVTKIIQRKFSDTVEICMPIRKHQLDSYHKCYSFKKVEPK